jgi:hypothetical protein
MWWMMERSAASIAPPAPAGDPWLCREKGEELEVAGRGGACESGWNTRTRGRDEASAGAGKVICDGDRGVSEKLLSIGPCRMARADT